MDEVLDIRDNPLAHRYEARFGSVTGVGTTAVASYRVDGHVITFEHTRVPPELEGRGVGARLVKFALDDVRRRGMRVVARCPFVAAYIRGHAEYQDLLA